MTSAMKLSVVIVNYNVKHFLEQCLNSLEQAAAEIDYEVIVVDNASTDGSTEYITARFPQIKWMACRENNGFSKGNNIAIAQAKGEYILLLNPDTIVTKEGAEAYAAEYAAILVPEEELDDEPMVKIERVKHFEVKPMDAEEAVMEMELVGHNFFVFRNGETDEVNVVYKRKNGTYGLIEPEY